jgi:heme exporter protein C
MKHWWWKALGVLLLAYSIYFGLSTPLKPAIAGVNSGGQVRAVSGPSVKVTVQGYNTDFRPGTIVILKRGPLAYRASDVRVASPTELEADFNLLLGAAGNSSVVFNLITADQHHGFMEFDAALAIEKVPGDTLASTAEKGDLFSGFKFTEETGNTGLTFPYRNVLEETVRNLLLHVPQWFSMILLLLIAAIYSGLYLHRGRLVYDAAAKAFTMAGLLAGTLGTLTGSVWARATWNAWWTSDPKLNGVAVGMAMYLAYVILRASVDDRYNRARLAAVYNLFVFPVFIALIVVMPKLSAVSLHPGSGDSVNFSQYDMDNTLRMFFYPAVIGWTLLYAWMAQLQIRLDRLRIERDLRRMTDGVS